nr:uncharacterized protein LOC109158503 [Ipomoea batatas]
MEITEEMVESGEEGNQEMESVEVDAARTVANNEGDAAARPNTKGSHPYGTWMIATRRERRRQGGQVGRQNEGGFQRENNRKGKEAAIGNGSRFALLGNTEENEGSEPQVEAATVGNSTPESQMKGLGGKSKRANVIVNEKQIQNETRPPSVAPETNIESSQGRRLAGSSSRRADEEDEHVVSCGAQEGKVVRSTVVHTGDSNGANVPELNLSDTEHHEDPPPGGFDHEGDVIMDEDSPQAMAEAAGGDRCPAN